MSAEPWFRFFPSDWLGGTAGLSAAEKGVYVTLLAAIYDCGGPIKRDDARLARQCGLPKASFVRALSALVDCGKIENHGDFLSNERAKNELTERENRIGHSREGARVTNAKKQALSTNVSRSTERSTERSTGATRARVPQPHIELSSDNSKRASAPKSSDAILDLLTEGGLSRETAEGVIAHRKAKKCPLTALAARELVKGFNATGDPEDAARVMVARGWQGFKLDWYDEHKAHSNGTRNGKLSVQDAARKLAASVIDFGPVPPPYVGGNRNEASGGIVGLLPQGGRGGSGDLLGGSSGGPKLLSRASRLPSD